MIKNILIRRKESDTYLATVSRNRWSQQIAMKVDKMCSVQPALWSINFSRFSFYITISSYNLKVTTLITVICMFLNTLSCPCVDGKN